MHFVWSLNNRGFPFLTRRSCAAGVSITSNVGASRIRLLLAFVIVSILPVWNRFSCHWPSTPPFSSVPLRTFLVFPWSLHPGFLLLPLHLLVPGPILFCPGLFLRPVTFLLVLTIFPPLTFLLFWNISFRFHISFLSLFCLSPPLFLGWWSIHHSDDIGLTCQVEFANQIVGITFWPVVLRRPRARRRIRLVDNCPFLGVQHGGTFYRVVFIEEAHLRLFHKHWKSWPTKLMIREFLVDSKWKQSNSKFKYAMHCLWSKNLGCNGKGLKTEKASDCSLGLKDVQKSKRPIRKASFHIRSMVTVNNSVIASGYWQAIDRTVEFCPGISKFSKSHIVFDAWPSGVCEAFH